MDTDISKNNTRLVSAPSLGGLARLANRSFEDLWLWDEIDHALAWYYAVSTNKTPSQYLTSRRIPCAVNLKSFMKENPGTNTIV